MGLAPSPTSRLPANRVCEEPEVRRCSAHRSSHRGSVTASRTRRPRRGRECGPRAGGRPSGRPRQGPRRPRRRRLSAMRAWRRAGSGSPRSASDRGDGQATTPRRCLDDRDRAHQNRRPGPGRGQAQERRRLGTTHRDPDKRFRRPIPDATQRGKGWKLHLDCEDPDDGPEEGSGRQVDADEGEHHPEPENLEGRAGQPHYQERRERCSGRRPHHLPRPTRRLAPTRARRPKSG